MKHRAYIVKTFLLCKHITLNSTELIKHLCQFNKLTDGCMNKDLQCSHSLVSCLSVG